jgi:DNA-binding NarL/FixJ family response regulator
MPACESRAVPLSFVVAAPAIRDEHPELRDHRLRSQFVRPTVARMNAPLRLLIADDDPVMRMLLGAIVRADPSIELVAEAQDADEAIRLAAERQPDVVLLDVEMPGGGGLRAAREIRAENPTIRLLALSGHETGEARDAMREAGASGYVVKGSPPGEVLSALRSV